MWGAAEEEGIPMFRITLLGMRDSGKTSLINAFVNKVVPEVYTSTDEPQLYAADVDEEHSDSSGTTNSSDEIIHRTMSWWRSKTRMIHCATKAQHVGRSVT